MTALEILIALVTGLVAGAFAGAMGVGGGVIMVPVLTEAIGLEQTGAQGTSLAVIVVTAAVATSSAHRRGLLDVATAVRVSAGGLAGAVAGAVLATRVVDPTILRRLFACVVLLSAVRLAKRVFAPARGSDGSDAPPRMPA